MNTTKPATEKSEQASTTNQTSASDVKRQQQQSRNTNSLAGVHATTVEKSRIPTTVQQPVHQSSQSLTGGNVRLSAGNQPLQIPTSAQQPLQTLTGRTAGLSTNKQPLPQCKHSMAPTSSTEKPTAATQRTFRTITVPPGVSEGSMFHVLIEGGHKIGVVLPKGVRSGQTMIILEPGFYTAPISAKNIAKMNKARLVKGFDHNSAEFARRAFWEVLYPILETNGWTCMRGTYYNFGAYTFFPGQSLATEMNQFETISDILKTLVSSESCADAVRDFYRSIEKQKEALKSKEEQKKKRLQNALIPVPEKRIRIGTSFQVCSLPRGGSYEASNDDG